MSLAAAIAFLQAEVDSLNPGEASRARRQSFEGSTDWFLLRAKSLGLSCLKQMEKLAVGEDPGAAERVYKAMGKSCKHLEEVPAAIEVEKEQPPSGFILPEHMK